jgi:hypothetical protein
MEMHSQTANQGVANAQETNGFSFNGVSVTGQYVSTTQDTTSASSFAVTSQIGTATDWMVIEFAMGEQFADGA